MAHPFKSLNLALVFETLTHTAPSMDAQPPGTTHHVPEGASAPLTSKSDATDRLPLEHVHSFDLQSCRPRRDL